MTTSKLSHSNKMRLREVSFQMQKETIPEIKDMKTAIAEFHLWSQTYKEVIEIFVDIIPIPKEKQKSSSDKRNTLLKLCREVAKIAKDPKNSKEYRDLLKKFNECQRKLTDLIRKNTAMISDTYNFSHDDSYDTEQPDKAQIAIRLNNLDNILAQEIEQNKKYLPNHIENIENPSEVKEQVPLVKKTSNILSSPQRKKGKSVFPSASELLSSSFKKNSKNDIFQLPESTVNQNSFDISYSKIETNIPLSSQSPMPLKEQNQNESSRTNKSKQNPNEEIPFGKRSLSKKSKNRVKIKNH